MSAVHRKKGGNSKPAPHSKKGEKSESVLHLYRGRLSVAARGYWFTSGGEKGSFGYYPHLKRVEGGKAFPVIPDTQVHGDLKMAALWLSHLEEAKFPETLVQEVFGRDGNQSSALLSINDLELSAASKKRWSSDPFSRFVVKPRSEIDDHSRTNKTHMLAFQELSYLEGLTLETDFCLGYFKEKAKSKQALELVQEALCLLSGFGAFRSRGCGRGSITIDDKTIEHLAVESAEGAGGGKHGLYRYTITPLSPFRNKPINPAATQLLRSEKAITERQLKAWFARAFNDLFDAWPLPHKMAGIRFSTAYPALTENGTVTPAHIPPFSTLKFEDDTISDRFGDKIKPDDPADQENLVHAKAKPLDETLFLTNAKPPHVVELRARKRLRNHTTSTFATKDKGGLFAQEFIEKGQPFCATVSVPSDDEDFRKRAFLILKKVFPKLNGTFFKPRLERLESGGAAGKEAPKAFVLAEPLNFSPDRMEKGFQVRLDTMRNYNTTLRRPRRNRLVLAPGSLVTDDFEGAGLGWQWLSTPDSIQVPRLAEPPAEAAPTPLPQPEEALKKVTRAQAGNLRRLLEMTPALAQKWIGGMLEKYKRWGKTTDDASLIPKEYLEQAKQHLEAGGADEFRKYIQAVLQRYAVAAWNKKSNPSKGEADQGGDHGDSR